MPLLIPIIIFIRIFNQRLIRAGQELQKDLLIHPNAQWIYDWSSQLHTQLKQLWN